MFKKLNLKLPEIDIYRLKGEKTSPDFWGSYKEHSILDSTYLNEILSTRIELGILPDAIHLSTYYHIDPHVDNCETAMNYYLCTNSGTTYMYEFKEHIKNRNFPYLIPISFLNEIDNFVAETGDCYIMNTNIPHSVSGVGDRISLRFMWTHVPFNEVVSSIKIF